VPWLADIPVLGNLFRNRAEMEKTYELLVFLTPTIIKAEQGILSRKSLADEGGGVNDKKLISVPFAEQVTVPQSGTEIKGLASAHDLAQDSLAFENEQFIDPDPEQNVKIKPLIMK
jgi:Flp pilus assembly secretin CpaC